MLRLPETLERSEIDKSLRCRFESQWGQTCAEKSFFFHESLTWELSAVETLIGFPSIRV